MLLDTYGKGEIKLMLHELQTQCEELRLVAGGNPDGASWCADLPKEEATKAQILEAFNVSLKTINKDDRVTLLIESTSKVHRLLPYFRHGNLGCPTPLFCRSHVLVGGIAEWAYNFL